MVTAEPRDAATRMRDTLAMLATPEIDVWVATAADAGAPHLVPVSLAWVDERMVIAVEESSFIARNLAVSGPPTRAGERGPPARCGIRVPGAASGAGAGVARGERDRGPTLMRDGIWLI